MLSRTAASGREVDGVLELEGRRLADDRRPGASGGRPDRPRPAGVPSRSAEGEADVPGDGHVEPGLAVDPADQLDRRRLAVGPGHRDEVVAEQAPGQLELADHGEARVEPPRSRPAHHGERRDS